MQTSMKKGSPNPENGLKLPPEKVLGIVAGVITLLAAVVKLLEALHLIP